MSGNWSADPLADDEPVEVEGPCCADGSCPLCQVKAAGARELGEQAGFDYDGLDAHAQAHYREICGAVMAAMSEEMITVGLVAPKETQ